MERLSELMNKTEFKPNLRRVYYKLISLPNEMEIFKKIGTKYTLNDGIEFEIDKDNRFIIENLIK